MIGRSGERGSGISVLPARHDDDEYQSHPCRKTVVVLFNYSLKCRYQINLNIAELFIMKRRKRKYRRKRNQAIQIQKELYGENNRKTCESQKEEKKKKDRYQTDLWFMSATGQPVQCHVTGLQE